MIRAFAMKPLTLAAWCAALLLAANLFAHTVALRLLLLVAGCALAALALARGPAGGAPSQVRALPWLLLPFALWAAWAALSIRWSIDPARSLKEFKNEVLYTSVAFWLCYVAAQARGAPRAFLAVLSIGAVGVCAVGIYQFWFPAHEIRALDLWVGPGDRSSELLTLMPGALAGAWLSRKLGKPRALGAAALALAALFALSAFTTLNRTVWIGFSVELIIIGALLLPRLGRPFGTRAKVAAGLGALAGAWLSRKLGMPRGLGAAALALAALFALSAFTTLNRTVWIGFSVELIIIGALLLPRLGRPFGTRAKVAAGLGALAIVAGGIAVMIAVQQERFGPHVERTLEKDPRLDVWAAAIRMIERRPLTGLGFGRGIERHILRAEFPNRYHEYSLWHAHNVLLEVGVELGIPGMALLILLLAATLYQGWKLARGPDQIAAACGVALIAVVAGTLVRNMTDVLWVRQNSLLYWGVVGALLAWGQGRSKPAA